MSRLILSDSRLYSLQMKCFYISSEYKNSDGALGTSYIKDIFDDD